MRSLLAALACVVSLSGCSDKEFTCASARQCLDRYGLAGLCLEMRCAFPASECVSGYKWDDAAGERAGTCVDRALLAADAGVPRDGS
jgi:hypothetical protein